jgi:hypothetical protein
MAGDSNLGRHSDLDDVRDGFAGRLVCILRKLVDLDRAQCTMKLLHAVDDGLLAWR